MRGSITRDGVRRVAHRNRPRISDIIIKEEEGVGCCDTRHGAAAWLPDPGGLIRCQIPVRSNSVYGVMRGMIIKYGQYDGRRLGYSGAIEV